MATGAIGGEEGGNEDAEEEARLIEEARREQEEERKAKHAKMEEEREKERQRIRDKVMFVYSDGSEQGLVPCSLLPHWNSMRFFATVSLSDMTSLQEVKFATL